MNVEQIDLPDFKASNLLIVTCCFSGEHATHYKIMKLQSRKKNKNLAGMVKKITDISKENQKVIFLFSFKVELLTRSQ